MASGALKDYIGIGLASARPASPSLATGVAGYWYATDTAVLSVWDGTSWTDISSSSANVGILNGINAQSGTTYTLVLTDIGKDVQCTNASAITVTVPANSSVAFNVGSLIIISQWGAGAVTISAGTGVTVQAAHGSATTAQYDGRVLEKVATDTWVIW